MSRNQSPAPADVLDDDSCTFAPAINPDSERLLGDATNLPSTFAGRQRHYEEAKARRLRELRAELVWRRSQTALSLEASELSAEHMSHAKPLRLPHAGFQTAVSGVMTAEGTLRASGVPDS